MLPHFENDKPLHHTAEARENLAKSVKQGKGPVVSRLACGSLSDWPRFTELAGKVWDRQTGYHPRGPFAVKIADPQHAITRSMKDFRADDELYTCLTGERDAQVPTAARSNLTGKDHPMTLEYGERRVFNTPLGHDAKSIQMPDIAELVRRGCTWAAGREP